MKNACFSDRLIHESIPMEKLANINKYFAEYMGGDSWFCGIHAGSGTYV